MASLFNGVEPPVQFKICIMGNYYYARNYFEFGSVVEENLVFIGVLYLYI